MCQRMPSMSAVTTPGKFAEMDENAKAFWVTGDRLLWMDEILHLRNPGMMINSL